MLCLMGNAMSHFDSASATLQSRIAAAKAAGNWVLARQLEVQLDKLHGY